MLHILLLLLSTENTAFSGNHEQLVRQSLIEQVNDQLGEYPTNHKGTKALLKEVEERCMAADAEQCTMADIKMMNMLRVRAGQCVSCNPSCLIFALSNHPHAQANRSFWATFCACSKMRRERKTNYESVTSRTRKKECA